MKVLNAFSIQMLPNVGSANIRITDVTEEALSGAYINKHLESFLGHEDSARIISQQLRKELPVNRTQSTLAKGEQALVAQYIGPRLPEGSTTLPEGAQIKYFLVEVTELADSIQLFTDADKAKFVFNHESDMKKDAIFSHLSDDEFEQAKADASYARIPTIEAALLLVYGVFKVLHKPSNMLAYLMAYNRIKYTGRFKSELEFVEYIDDLLPDRCKGSVVFETLLDHINVLAPFAVQHMKSVRSLLNEADPDTVDKMVNNAKRNV